MHPQHNPSYVHDGHRAVLLTPEETAHLEIQLRGHGCADDAFDAPLALDYADGHWTLHVFADIGKATATHRIDLSGALESLRQNGGPAPRSLAVTPAPHTAEEWTARLELGTPKVTRRKSR